MLKTESGQEILKATTEKGGSFQLAPVQPGKYAISARHPSLRFSASSAVVIVTEGSVEVAPNALVIAGFDVSGVVVSNGDPVRGVHLLLYGADVRNTKYADFQIIIIYFRKKTTNYL